MRSVALKVWFPTAVALIYLYSFPYFERIRSANELPRIYLTMAMVDRQAFDIGDYVHTYQNTPDLSVHRGKYYANKAPGMSVFAIPGYLLLKLVGDPTDLKQLFFWLRLFGATLPSLLFLIVVWRVLGQLVAHVRLRQLVFLAYALGSMALVYGTVLVAHQLSAALIATAFYATLLYHRGHGPRRAIFWAGLAAGAAVFVDYQAAFIGPPLFIYVLVRAKPRVRSALLFCLGAAIPLASLLFYHQRCFGSPFETGYQHLANPIFAEWTSRGFLGLDTPRWGRLIKLHFSPDDGLFYYSPFLLLAFPGLLMMFRRRPLWPEALFSGVVIGFFIYFISALVLISGWDVGPRYIIVALPFYLVPVAIAAEELSRNWKAMIVPAGLMSVSVLLYVWIAAVFPHFPDNFSDPFYDLTVRFSLAHYLPYNLGWKLGLQGFYSIVPYLLLAGLLLGGALWGIAEGGLRKLAFFVGVLAVCCLLLAGYYGHLGYRTMPVPHSFLPWMERIWEPRNELMDPVFLKRQIGSPPEKKVPGHRNKR